MVDPEMSYTNLGSTGLEVSRLCLGCMNFGGPTDREESVEIIERALDLGINFFDTANVYNDGTSEEILGDALANRDRDELVIATKVYGTMGDGPNEQGLSRKHVLDQVEASLERLGTDYIDLYQIHRWDENTPIEETLSALDYLVETGKVRYIGASTMYGWQFMKALAASDEHEYERFTCMQPEYSLVQRHEEENMLPVADDQGIGVIPWSPLGGGFLTGKYERDNLEAVSEDDRLEWMLDEDERLPRQRFVDENWAVLDVVRELADERGATPAQIALAWTLHKPIVDAPIVGPRTVEHLEENAEVLDVSLSDEDVERLEEPKYVPPAVR